MQTDVAKLVGCTLVQITLLTFDVDFQFSNFSLSIRAKITRNFRFAIPNGDELQFDPTNKSRDDSAGSTKFILLQGLRCREATLSSEKFEIAFEDDSTLWIDFTTKDFEPLLLMGWEDRGELQFHWVT